LPLAHLSKNPASGSSGVSIIIITTFFILEEQNNFLHQIAIGSLEQDLLRFIPQYE